MRQADRRQHHREVITEETMNAQLIADTPKEEALIRIRSLQVQNATAAQRRKIESHEKKMYRHFFNSIETNFGLSKKTTS